MTKTPILNDQQFLFLKKTDARFARQGLYAIGETIALLGGAIAVPIALMIDFAMLEMLHNTYSEEGYHSTAFAASGLVVVLALHIVAETFQSKKFDRILATIAAVCALVFVVGTCLMIGTIALTQGISGLGETFPEVDAFFDQAQATVDDYFGPSAFEEFMTSFAVPLFTLAVCTAFALTVFLTKWLIGWLVRRVPVVARRIANARRSAELFSAVKKSLSSEQQAQAQLRAANERVGYWDPKRIADLMTSIREEVLRPYDVLVTHHRLTGAQEDTILPVPFADGTPPFKVSAMEKVLTEIRDALSHDEISTALNRA